MAVRAPWVERAVAWLLDRMVPPLIVATLLSVLVTSPAGFAVWHADGAVSTVFVVGYAAVLLVAWVMESARWWAWAGAMATFVFGGRVAAFIEAEILRDPDTFSLVGNIIERVLLLVLVGPVFHGLMAWRLGFRRSSGSTGNPRSPIRGGPRHASTAGH